MQEYENISLKPLNTFGIDVRAKRLIEIDIEADDIARLCEGLEGERWMMLGSGSNIVFTKDYDGTIVRIGNDKARTVGDDTVEADAGMELDRLIAYCIANGLYGIENLSAIPGTVGAAIVQNAGAYGTEMKDVVAWVEVHDTKARQRVRLQNSECRFDYRNSIFKKEGGRYVVLRVGVQLKKKFVAKKNYKAIAEIECGSAEELRQAIVEMRWQKLPRPEEHGSAGSFFKNPIVDKDNIARLRDEYPDMPVYGENKLSAGWLIEKSGWKGRNEGRVGVWPRQALVLYNRGECTGEEVATLAEKIRSDVKERFDILLEPEAIII